MADSYFSHIRFVNRPVFPGAESRAESVTAEIVLFNEDLKLITKWPGRWADNDESPPQRDRRPQRRIAVEPDGQAVSLDVTIRNLGAYTVFGYNDESLSHDRGFDEAKALAPNLYVMQVILQGIRVPATTYWFDLLVGSPTQEVAIQERLRAPIFD